MYGGGAEIAGANFCQPKADLHPLLWEYSRAQTQHGYAKYYTLNYLPSFIILISQENFLLMLRS